MKKIWILTFICALCLVACSPISAQEGNPVMRPYPQHTTYTKGSILPNHRTQEQLDKDVSNFYDYWKKEYVINAGIDTEGHSLYRIAFGKDNSARLNTVSEAQGFGMIILPVMAGYDSKAQEIFDGLWRFAKAHPSEVDPRLMDWNLLEEEGNDSAFDGDADIALGLLMADAQWGSRGEINYKAEAENVITGILESTIGPESHLPTLGDWVDADGEDYNQFMTRSSDFMLVNFRAYGSATNDPAWNEVSKSCLSLMTDIQSTYSPVSGLMPDFIVLQGNDLVPQPAPADFLEGEHDGHFYYNAGRVPWRVGADALLNGNEDSIAIVQKISLWAETAAGGDPQAIRSGYDLEGNPIDGSDYFSTFFAAPLGVAAMSNPTQQEWLNIVYDAVYDTHEDYYEDSVNLLSLIVMSGNAWTP